MSAAAYLEHEWLTDPPLGFAERTPMGRVICGCGRPTGRWAFRRAFGEGVLYYLGAGGASTNTDRGEAIRLIDHWGAVYHRCRRRDWRKGARLRLDFEAA
jgi:hypothetical protein